MCMFSKKNISNLFQKLKKILFLKSTLDEATDPWGVCVERVEVIIITIIFNIMMKMMMMTMMTIIMIMMTMMMVMMMMMMSR